MDFKEYYLKEIIEQKMDDTDFAQWLMKAKNDFRPISLEDAERLLDTQEGIDTFINQQRDSNTANSELSGQEILMNLINGVG